MAGFMALLTLLVIGVGIYGLIRGRVATFRIGSRKTAAMVLVAGFVLLLIAGAIAPKVPRSAENESQPKQTAPITVEPTQPSARPETKENTSPLSIRDWFTETQVYVECSPALAGMSCSIERRTGNQDVTACWEMEFVCINGAKTKANACHPVQRGGGSKSTRIIQWTEFSEYSLCDTVRSFTISNIVVRRN
jgi:hypothetical protein